MDVKERILITGVSGLLGSNLGLCWKDQHDVLGTYNTHPVDLQGGQTKRVDILSNNSLRRVVKDFGPDVLIHCAALADVDACQENMALVQQMNVHMVTRVADALADTQAKLVYISSDSVYGGSRGNHNEEEKVNPVNQYGHSKYLGELEALKYPGALVLRTAFFGWNTQNKMSFAQQVVSKLSSRQPIKGFTDVFSSMIYTYDLAELLIKAIQKDLKGVYNLACRTNMTKYDFAVAVAKEFKLDASLIEPTSIDNFDFKAKRGKNLAMSVVKLSDSLKEEILSLEESIKHFCDDLKYRIPRFWSTDAK